jgi:hypothetical protein
VYILLEEQVSVIERVYATLTSDAVEEKNVSIFGFARQSD